MPMLTPMTELDAVNEMLMSIGQNPVNTLAVSGIRDVNIARLELTKVLRRVQLIGFSFNTDEDYPLSPDIDGRMAVPAGVLRIDPMDPNQDLVARKQGAGMAMWDRANRTFVISQPVKFRIVWGYAYDDLPEAAKNFIAISAARKFQKRTVGSDSLDGYNAEDEQNAWNLVLRDERAVQDTNMFRRSNSLRRLGDRTGRRRVTYP